MRRRPACLRLGLISVLVVVTLPACLTRGTEWGCSEFLYAHGDAVSGYRTKDEAIRAAVHQLARMGLSEGQIHEALQAITRSSGDSSYERDSGRLYLDGELVAEFKAGKLADGSFIVGTLKTCTPSSRTT